MKPTWVVNVGEKLPTEEQSFDFCLSMNTLEHVYDSRFLIREMYRSLKPGGGLHLAVPWMVRIHGHPDDFTRTTPSWWRNTLEETGFVDTKITPLIWGRRSTGAILSGKRGIGFHLAHVRDVLYSKLFFDNGSYSGDKGERICNVALGHFISATK
jgi:SAM-dependent methyltransferase